MAENKPNKPDVAIIVALATKLHRISCSCAISKIRVYLIYSNQHNQAAAFMNIESGGENQWTKLTFLKR